MWQHAEQAQGNISHTPSSIESQTGQTTAVEQPWMVERKGERVLWRIKAKEADQGIQTMHLIQPYLELFNDAGEKITIIGQEADVQMVQHDVLFQHQVQVHYQDWVLHCEHLRYDKNSDDIVVSGHFSAQRPNTEVTGRGLRVHQESRIIHILHDVHIVDTANHSGDLL